MESCRADWHACNGETAVVAVLVKGQTVDVPKLDDLPLLLNKDADWTQGVCSIDRRLVLTCGLYCGELTAMKFSVLRTPLAVVRNRRKMFSTILALGHRLERAKYCERDPQSVCKAADEKLEKMNREADGLVALQKTAGRLRCVWAIVDRGVKESQGAVDPRDGAKA